MCGRKKESKGENEEGRKCRQEKEGLWVKREEEEEEDESKPCNHEQEQEEALHKEQKEEGKKRDGSGEREWVSGKREKESETWGRQGIVGWCIIMSCHETKCDGIKFFESLSLSWTLMLFFDVCQTVADCFWWTKRNQNNKAHEMSIITELRFEIDSYFESDYDDDDTK